MGLASTINLYESIFIRQFQDMFPGSESFFLGITKVSDPAYAIAILFPVAASVNTSLGADILVVSVIAEWFNTLLKWLLMEDRPYWWVREFHDLGAPDLQQTPLTCETGPGSPSGHVMGFAALLFAIVRWIIADFIKNSSELQENQKRKRIWGLWVIVIIMLIMVALSRVYIAAHFPHQCILGAVLGILVGYLLTDNGRWCVTDWWQKGGRFRMLVFSVLMIGISAGSYFLQIALGIDPQWSVRLAFKWCRSPEFVHVVTTPLFSLVRVCGATLGIALAAPVKQRGSEKFYPVIGVVLVTLLVVSLQMLRDLIPTSNAVAFYLCQLFLFAALAFLLIFFVPAVASLVKVKRD